MSASNREQVNQSPHRSGGKRLHAQQVQPHLVTRQSNKAIDRTPVRQSPPNNQWSH